MKLNCLAVKLVPSGVIEILHTQDSSCCSWQRVSDRCIDKWTKKGESQNIEKPMVDNSNVSNVVCAAVANQSQVLLSVTLICYLVILR